MSVAISYYNALSRNDGHAAAALLDPGVTVDVPGATLQGPAQFRAWIQVFFDAFPDIEYELSSLMEQHGAIRAEVVIAGTHSGAFVSADGTLRPTHRRVTFPASNVMHVNAGRVIRMVISFDQSGLIRQLATL